jgi:protein-S-isoprenylcysteine O-methyltransferase Ste14
MKYLLKQLTSFLLPITVLILVPWWIEKDISIKYYHSFLAGAAFMVMGLAMISLTVYQFITFGKGTLAPWYPTGKLVLTGLYAYVRNPMISGVLMVLAGESLSISSLKIFYWLLLFFVINNIFFLVYEEPNLEKRFGSAYLDYKKNVPRWIPRLKPYQPA